MPSPPQTRRVGPRAGLLPGLAGCVVLLTGCETLRPEPGPEAVARSTASTDPPPAPPTTLPGKFATRRGYYVLYHDFELDRSDPRLVSLESLADRVYEELRLPPANTVIQVFLFESQDRYERYMFAPKARYRHLPSRRAYFITEPRLGGGDELKVFTWAGAHLETDLRHELTHALLHAVLKDVPLWLDEGLAGFFELPPEYDGINLQHLEALRRGPFRPDLARLEKLDQVRQMEKPEYREAWAWVHFMLRGDPAARRVLHDYLQLLRTTCHPGPLLPRLRDAVPDPERALLDHLATIEPPRQSR